MNSFVQSDFVGGVPSPREAGRESHIPRGEGTPPTKTPLFTRP